MSLLFFLLIYFSTTFIVLNYIYFNLSVYYRHLSYKDKETGKIKDLNEIYDPFRPYDPINYFQFISYGLFLFPIRGILSFVICVFLCLNLKYLKCKYKELDTDSYEYSILSEVIKFWSFYFFLSMGYL